ncbi:MAG TPA: metalloregulator ArsR/SmtB family transcription factor [Geothermobacteraceae bacterium]|nr:metalloregulator ArsR/SmtB family transcription factor [Geothermobacteraceae bacterium]
MKAMKTTADIMKAFGDETRLRILALLADGELCVCEIFAALNLPQSTVSRHLAILRRAGWLLGRRQGSWMYYGLENNDDFRKTILHGLLSELKKTQQGRDDRETLKTFLAHRGPRENC